MKKIAFCAKKLLTTEIFIIIIQIVARYATKTINITKGGENVNISKLKAKIVERNMNVEKLAAAINVDRSSLYRKLNNAEKITIGEAGRMKTALNMSDTEAYEIFLA